MIMVRYADDLVVGFQHENDARRFWDAMRERLREFSLSLHPDKTRLIAFGRHAAQNCKKRGLAKPETFTFLGFVLICGTTRNGKFLLRRKSRRDRMRAKLREIKEELRRRMHRPIPETGKWLAQVVSGFQALSRGAHKQRGDRRLPLPHHRSLAPGTLPAQPEGTTGVAADDETGRRVPSQAACPPSVAEHTLRCQAPKVGAECPNWARSDLCGGCSAMNIPTANTCKTGL